MLKFVFGVVIMLSFPSVSSAKLEGCLKTPIIYAGKKLKDGTYMVQYSRPEFMSRQLFDGVLVLTHGNFEKPGRIRNGVVMKRDGEQEVLIDGYSHKVPLFKECKADEKLASIPKQGSGYSDK